jgi:hypothetical protein
MHRNDRELLRLRELGGLRDEEALARSEGKHGGDVDELHRPLLGGSPSPAGWNGVFAFLSQVRGIRVFASLTFLAALAAPVPGASALPESTSGCTVTASRTQRTIVGTGRSDVICGNGRANVIYGRGGNDVIYGGGGNDVIYGGAGDDMIYGGSGRNRLYGGAGNDLVFARNGARDIVSGGSGHNQAMVDPRDRRTRIQTVLRATAPKDPVLLAAGDIARCSSFGDWETASLLDAYPYATVATIGDNAYETGSASEYANCYAPTWGRALDRTHPALGNHEYLSPGAAPSFAYFGSRLGTGGYYSYDLGAWHVVVLNTNGAETAVCDEVPCGAGSAQEQWLRADLQAHPARCTLAYFHHARFSSGSHGNNSAVGAIWNDLYAAGVDVVVNGHDHDYERFAPQDPSGRADPTHGIREFIVGTGGAGNTHWTTLAPNSQVRNDTSFGVLKLTLAPSGYTWSFLPAPGSFFTDAGAGDCH